MQISTLFTLAAGLFASAVTAEDKFSNAVALSLHHTKGNNTHCKTMGGGDNQVTERTANKTAQGIYLIGGLNQKITFEWSPDTSRVPIQEVRTYPQMPPYSLT
jgi:hypothetical protein